MHPFAVAWSIDLSFPFADLVMGTTDVVHVLCADQSAAPGGRAATVA